MAPTSWLEAHPQPTGCVMLCWCVCLVSAALEHEGPKTFRHLGCTCMHEPYSVSCSNHLDSSDQTGPWIPRFAAMGHPCQSDGAGPVLRELLQDTSLGKLQRCWRFSGPGSATGVQRLRKHELATIMAHGCRDAQVHGRVVRDLLSERTMEQLRAFLVMLRRLGQDLPPISRAGCNKTDLITTLVESDARIQDRGAIHNDTGPSIDHSHGQGGTSQGQCVDPRHGHEGAIQGQAVDPSHGQEGASQGTSQGQGVHPSHGHSVNPSQLPPEMMMMLVAHDSAAGPCKLRLKLHKRWMKLNRKAIRKTKLRGVRQAVQEAVEQQPADSTIGFIKKCVEEKLQISLDGKRRLLFDIALHKIAACRPRLRRKRTRFQFAVCKAHLRKHRH